MAKELTSNMLLCWNGRIPRRHRVCSSTKNGVSSSKNNALRFVGSCWS